MHRIAQSSFGALVLVLMLMACRSDSTGASFETVALPLASQTEDDRRLFSDWSAPVNLGTTLNSFVEDVTPFESKGALSLYYASFRDGFGGPSDLWVSERRSEDAPWGPPQNLGPVLNTAANETSPRLSADGHRLYFASDRAGGSGGTDLYVSRRRDKRDNFGWEAPVNLGVAVNSAGNEDSPTFFEDEATETVTMYFDSDRPGRGDRDIYSSTRTPDGAFSPAVLDEALSTTAREREPAIRRDGLEVFFVSNRLPRVGMTDLWVATRATTADPWSAPVNLGPVVNTTFVDGSPALSRDGTRLYFHSNANRPGRLGPCFGDQGPCFFDIYVTTREKLKE